MKDLKTYLESGILELYVLGDLSGEEIREVESTIAQYPAVKAEVEEIENALQAYAISNAIEPSEAVRTKILNSIASSGTAGTPVVPMYAPAPSSSF
ncbi:MAG: hypothetical protein WKF69_12725, partial [Daejeonella sp.]